MIGGSSVVGLSLSLADVPGLPVKSLYNYSCTIQYMYPASLACYECLGVLGIIPVAGALNLMLLRIWRIKKTSFSSLLHQCIKDLCDMPRTP